MKKFKSVDVVQYVNDLIKNGVRPMLYTEKIHLAVKSAMVRARPGTVGEQIITKMANGLVETINTVSEKDSWIITNPDGEEYIIKNSTFVEKYHPVPTEGGMYLPKPKPQLFIQIDEDISFLASWGEDMNILSGGFLNITKLSSNDVYGIQGPEFAKTYSPFNVEA